MPKLFNRKKQTTGDTTPEQKAAPESKKKLEDYEQSQPVQMSLFGFLDLKPTE